MCLSLKKEIIKKYNENMSFDDCLVVIAEIQNERNKQLRGGDCDEEKVQKIQQEPKRI